MDKPMIQQYMEIYKAYRADMVNFCRARLDDPALAEDGVQQIFLALYESLTKGTEIVEPRAWLYKTARFVIIRINEKGQNDRSHISPVEYEEAVYTASVSFDSCLAAVLETDQEEKLVQTVMSRLTKEEQDLIDAVYARGMKHEEVGRCLGMKRNTVSQRLKRLRLKVEKIIEDVLQKETI